MKRYKKTIDGKTIVRAANNISVTVEKLVTRREKTVDADGKVTMGDVETLEKFRVFNPTHEQILADGWEEVVKHVPTAEELLERAKLKKVAAIKAHDTSSAVNSFYYGDVEYWLDRDTRVSVRSTAEIMKEMGRETMTLWLGDVNVTLSPAEVLQMLAVLEVYALECYNTTAEHKAKVNALVCVEDVEIYDHTTGYPEKIHL